MARIILYLNDQFLREIPLSRETITIGRKPDNDVSLDHHAVSGYHAQIITLLNDSFVEDLGSTNGTRVNDTPIRKRALKEGDTISIYHYRLVYTRLSGSLQPLASDQLEKTMIVRMDALGLPNDAADARLEQAVRKLGTEPVMERPRAIPGPLRPTPQASPVAEKPGPVTRPVATPAPTPSPQTRSENPPPRSARLQILSGPNAGRSLELVKALTTLGRPGVQVAAISRRTQGYKIIHVDGGASGESPKVNGKPIGKDSHGLNNGDVIDIAGVRMEFKDR